MKRVATIVLLLIATAAQAQNAYEIKVTLKPFKNQYIYLGHYFGKQLPIIDSVLLNDKSEGVFKGNKKLGGGIYLIGFPDKTGKFEMLVDKNQKFSVVVDTADIANPKFTNSPENTAFVAYQKFMTENGRRIEALVAKRNNASNAKDSADAQKELDVMNAVVKQYRNDLMSREPDGILSALLHAMKEPEVPDTKNNPEAQADSLFAYKYFKKHYWDGVHFWDDRIARTPFFEARVDKYFEQLVYPAADSVIKEMDWMMGFANHSPDMQRFLLLKFVNRYYNQKYMWEDAVFVHLFEKYFAQKNYDWLTERGRKMVTDRAYSLMANLLGAPAADIALPNLESKMVSLYNISAPFTVVAIWDPTCGHCKEILPRLDSFYHSKWKNLGVQFFALAKETDGTKKMWEDFIKDKKLQYWNHVWYTKEDDKARTNSGVPSYLQLYDIQSYPTLYLLDKDKRIIAKKVTEKQIDEIIEFKLKNQ